VADGKHQKGGGKPGQEIRKGLETKQEKNPLAKKGRKKNASEQGETDLENVPAKSGAPTGRQGQKGTCSGGNARFKSGTHLGGARGGRGKGSFAKRELRCGGGGFGSPVGGVLARR